MQAPCRSGGLAHNGLVELRPKYPVRTGRLALRPLRETDIPGPVQNRGREDVCRLVPFDPVDAAAVQAQLRGPWARSELSAEGEGLTLGVELASSGRCWVT